MIGEECSLYTLSEENKVKMGANRPPGSRNRNCVNIFTLLVRKVVFCVPVIFVWICLYLSNCYFNDLVVNKCDICHTPTFRSSLNGSFVAAEPYWLISGVKIIL